MQRFVVFVVFLCAIGAAWGEGQGRDDQNSVTALKLENKRLRDALRKVQTVVADVAAAVDTAVVPTPKPESAPRSAPTSRSSWDAASIISAVDGLPQVPQAAWAPPRHEVNTGEMGNDAPERMYFYPTFLSPEECGELIRLATPEFEPSRIMKTSEVSVNSPNTRESDTAYLYPNDDPLVRRVLERVHEAAAIPMRFGEDFQLTRYPPGGKYEFHYDSSMSLGRIATFLIYLNDVEEGGETVFPFARTGHTEDLPTLTRSHSSEKPNSAAWCNSSEVLKFRPTAGSAVLWFNHRMDLSMDWNALHAGCATTSTKYIAQRWFRWYHGNNNFFDVLNECELL